MKKLTILILAIFTAMACKNEQKEAENTAMESKDSGVYEAVFIDVQGTEIPSDIDQNVAMERTLLSDINFTGANQFWDGKNDFVMFGMGSIHIPDSGDYYFRLTSAGKITLRLDNKVLIENKEVVERQLDLNSTYLDAGYVIFEYEYYPSSKDPILVLEWSKDGENFEIVPASAFDNLDSFTVPNWEGEGIATEENNVQDNTLTQEEIAAGWELLFDGKTTKGWHTYNKPGTIGKKWKVENGMFTFEGRKRFEFYVAGRKIELGPTNKAADGGEDIVSDKKYENFELKLEWKLSEAGNNGIFYTVQEDTIYDEIWKTSPEMQVIDNQKHKDGLIYKHRAGDLYDLIASEPIRVRDQGNWNQVRIVKNQGKVEHWLNGTKVVTYDVTSPEWKDMISKSKFKDLKEFATPGPGHIGIQDHDNLVYFKNIKIRPIK